MSITHRIPSRTGETSLGYKLFAAAFATLSSSVALAVDGTWTSTTSSNWETNTRWSGNTIANGAGSAANFSANVPAAGVTVTLTTERTIGSLTFQDTDLGSVGNWTLSDGGDPTKVLTLQSAAPTVAVNTMGMNNFAKIDLTLAGTDGFTKVGPGMLVLSGTNTFTGGITASRGTLRIGDGTKGSVANQALTLDGASVHFNQAADVSSSMGALALTGGATTLTSTYAGAGSAGVTFAEFSQGTATTGNFVVSGGENGNTNRITLTGHASGFMNQGLFFGGNNYAWYDPSGFVRGIAWGTDAGSTTIAGGSSIASTGYAQTTGAISAQATETFTALNIVNTVNSAQQFKLATGAVLTTDGILRSGNGGSSSTTTISVGSIRASTGADLVLRADQAGDLLTISSNIIANGENGLIKTGAGGVTLSGTNSYTGRTTIVEGVLTAGNAAAFGDTEVDIVGGVLALGATTVPNTINLKGGTLRGSSGAASGTVNVLTNSSLGESSNSNATTFRVSGTLDVNPGVTLSIFNSNGHVNITGTLKGAGLIDNQNLGSFTLSSANPDFTGTFSHRRGTLMIGDDAALGDGTLLISSASGSIYVRSTDATGRTIASPVTFGSGTTFSGTGSLTFTGAATLGTSDRSLTVQNVTKFQGGLAGTGGILLPSATTGTLILAGSNSYTGPTNVSNGVLQLDGSLTSVVTVNLGTLSGNGGSTSRAITIGDGMGTTDAILSPGAGIGTLTTAGLLRIRNDGVLDVQFNSATLQADLIRAAGVTLDATSTLRLGDLASETIAAGVTFMLVENTAAGNVSGTFTGLPEGVELVLDSNTFVLSYVGGDGNDIVLTSVPEPGLAGAVMCGSLALIQRRRVRKGS